MGLQEAVQLIEDQTRLHGDSSCVRIEIQHLVEVLADIDHQRRANGLTALRRAAAARQDRNPVVPCDLYRADNVIPVCRHYHPDRLDLIDRGIGRIAAAAERIEQDIAFEFAA